MLLLIRSLLCFSGACTHVTHTDEHIYGLWSYMSGRKPSLADWAVDRFAFYSSFLQYLGWGVLLTHRLCAPRPTCGELFLVPQVCCDDRICSCFGGAIRQSLSLIQQGWATLHAGTNNLLPACFGLRHQPVTSHAGNFHLRLLIYFLV